MKFRCAHAQARVPRTYTSTLTALESVTLQTTTLHIINIPAVWISDGLRLGDVEESLNERDFSFTLPCSRNIEYTKKKNNIYIPDVNREADSSRFRDYKSADIVRGSPLTPESQNDRCEFPIENLRMNSQ